MLSSQRFNRLWLAVVSIFAFAASARAVDFVPGIDISAYQGNITDANWQQIKGAGYKFAFARVSLGSCCDHDANYVNNFDRAIAAGIPIGPYAVGYPQTNMSDPNDAKNEANYLVSLMSTYYQQNPGRLLRPVLDIELPTNLSLSQSYVSQWVISWANTIKAGLGVDPIVYTYPSYADVELNSSVTYLPLWIASYNTTPPTLPAPSAYNPWSDFKFWQYSSTGTVPGIVGNVDLDVYKGTIQNMAANYIVGFLPGDYNGDHKVDSLDYVKWQDTYGQSVGYGAGADGDLSGTIDAADFDVWKSHFGTSSSGGGRRWRRCAIGRPEPGTLLLVMISAAMLAAKRCCAARRSRWRSEFCFCRSDLADRFRVALRFGRFRAFACCHRLEILFLFSVAPQLVATLNFVLTNNDTFVQYRPWRPASMEFSPQDNPRDGLLASSRAVGSSRSTTHRRRAHVFLRQHRARSGAARRRFPARHAGRVARRAARRRGRDAQPRGRARGVPHRRRPRGDRSPADVLSARRRGLGHRAEANGGRPSAYRARRAMGRGPIAPLAGRRRDVGRDRSAR